MSDRDHALSHVSARLKKLRPFSLHVAGRRRTQAPLAVAVVAPPRSLSPVPSTDPYANLVPRDADDDELSDAERARIEAGYEWELESAGTGNEEPAYSWIDPSLLGTARLRATPPTTSETAAPPSRSTPSRTGTPQGKHVELPTRPSITPADSYKLLLKYQSTSPSLSSPATQTPAASSHASSASDAPRKRPDTPEWHEMVDPCVLDSLSRDEVKRQGLWWELVRGEREYVADLKVFIEAFIVPLEEHEPPLITPDQKLHAFVAEVFSTTRQIYVCHGRLLDKLMQRQRTEWPLITSATDLLLDASLEVSDLYEAYIKNYPFAENRVRREIARNSAFAAFLRDRNTDELTRRRDVSVFLSRPLTRLPRLALMLDTILERTPADHPDCEDLPTASGVIRRVVRSSQPGIEAAESKVKLWDLAERLMFRKGEVIELDVAEPKRTLVFSGVVHRRVRSETNWLGWQDLHAFLLDNYLLLTREVERGKYAVVSRPIHIDFLTLEASDGAPERRHDVLPAYRRRSANEPNQEANSEKLMFPFTITIGPGGKSYTLCTATDAARQNWAEKIESTKSLRQFDLESNRVFALHHISGPAATREAFMAADTFMWLNRQTMAVATSRSVWIGWRNDSHSYRELIKLQTGTISTIAALPQFSTLLILASGSLLAFSLDDLVPTFDLNTWVQRDRQHAVQMNGAGELVHFFRVGSIKGRVLIAFAIHARNAHTTSLTFVEPLLPDRQTYDPSFRPFATSSVPGHATELAFFKQTAAVVSDRGVVVVEPGNPAFSSLPLFPPSLPSAANVVKLVSAGRAMGMYQIGEGEFLVVYDWGACYVSKYGEVARAGAYMRWNLTPSHIVFKAPHVLVFDSGGRAEVRHMATAKLAEVFDEPGTVPVPRAGGGSMLMFTKKGMGELVETVEL
ncbi:hypothetical protein Q5752_002921 [Cryptotrichosporon argae]